MCADRVVTISLIWYDMICLNVFFEKGRYRELGLIGFSAAKVAYVHHYCSIRGWVKPSVYQVAAVLV